MPELKQVIIVNMELGMSRGKIAAQVAHAAVEASLLSINRK
jgi:peptidyl-tRNA hydrolase